MSTSAKVRGSLLPAPDGGWYIDRQTMEDYMKSLANRSARLVLGFVMLSAFLSGCAGNVCCSGDPSGLILVSQVSSTSSRLSSSTSGTSEGDKSAFVEARFAAIRYDAARGYGENLDTLATLLGEPDRVEFARWMKAHYGDLFVGLDAPSQLLVRIEARRRRES